MLSKGAVGHEGALETGVALVGLVGPALKALGQELVGDQEGSLRGLALGSTASFGAGLVPLLHGVGDFLFQFFINIVVEAQGLLAGGAVDIARTLA